MSTPSGPELAARFDHYDPALVEDPYEVFRLLREEAPVARSEAYGGVWVVSRYADVYAVAQDPATFSSAAAGVALPGMYDPARPLIPIELDPPEQRPYRQLVNRAFAPATIDALRGFITATADELIDRFVERGAADLAAEFAFQLPTVVIAEIMGVPAGDQARFRDWTVALLDVNDPAGAVAAVKAFRAYCLELADRRRAEPTGDLTSHLVHATVDGRPLSRDEVLGYLLELIAAGHETTTSAIGNYLLFLGRQPDIRARLAADPSRLPAAVEELLRYESPVQVLRRTVTRDVELGGQRLAAGDAVIVLWGSANRDESEFDAAGTFVEGRAPNRHLAFGCGPHRCLGSHLARVEIVIALERVLARLPDYEVVADGVERYMGIVRSTRRLPVRFTPGTRPGTTPAPGGARR